MPSRTFLAALAVVSTFVPAIDATTAPIDWGANLPVSKVSVLSVPDTGPDTVMGSATEGSFRVHSPSGVRLSERRAGSQLVNPNEAARRTRQGSDSATGNRSTVRSCCGTGRSGTAHELSVDSAGSAATDQRRRP